LAGVGWICSVEMHLDSGEGQQVGFEPVLGLSGWSALALFDVHACTTRQPASYTSSMFLRLEWRSRLTAYLLLSTLQSGSAWRSFCSPAPVTRRAELTSISFRFLRPVSSCRPLSVTLQLNRLSLRRADSLATACMASSPTR